MSDYPIRLGVDINPFTGDIIARGKLRAPFKQGYCMHSIVEEERVLDGDGESLRSILMRMVAALDSIPDSLLEDPDEKHQYYEHENASRPAVLDPDDGTLIQSSSELQHPVEIGYGHDRSWRPFAEIAFKCLETRVGSYEEAIERLEQAFCEVAIDQVHASGKVRTAISEALAAISEIQESRVKL